MSKIIDNLEGQLEELNTTFLSLERIKVRLEKEKSDLSYYLRLSEQNMKYLKKSVSVPMASQYDKINQARLLAEEQIRTINKQLSTVDRDIESLKKDIDIKTKKTQQEKNRVVSFKKTTGTK